jgi:uncharacterized protein (DUF885 family)
MLPLAACQTPQKEQPATAARASDNAWDRVTSTFIEEYFSAQPIFAAAAGRHEYDGKFPDWSQDGIAREVARLKAKREEIERIRADSLTEAQQVERTHLITVLNEDLFWLDRAQWPFVNPMYYMDRIDPTMYLMWSYAPLEKRMAALVTQLQGIPQVATHVKANMRLPLPRSYVERAIAGFGGYAVFYRKNVPTIFASVQDADLQKQLAAATDAAARSMDELKIFFEDQRKTATDRFALGPDLFSAMLRDTEGVNFSLEELANIGRADLARNLAKLKSACAEFAPQASIHECTQKLGSHKPQGSPVAIATEQVKMLRTFVESNRIASIPGTEAASVIEAPPYKRGNIAYIMIPGPYETGLPSTYYISPPDPAWNAAERAAYIPDQATLLFISSHEVWPGHFLQFLHANRNPTKTAALWKSYANTEGWAHYTEEMMWDSGLGERDPEYHVSQLLAALLRDARFLSAIGLHTQGMTLQESEKLFRDSAYTDPGTARQNAMRGTYDPQYLKYTLGKLMIMKLREDWTRELPAGTDRSTQWFQFHNRFLSYGGLPIPLVRKAMVGDDAKLF